MTKELGSAGNIKPIDVCPGCGERMTDARLFYSMWDGYLVEEKTSQFLGWLKGRGIPMYKCHTSGHASVSDLQLLRTAFAGAVVCPVHTTDPMAFTQLFENVRVLTDGEHFDINRFLKEEKTI